MGVVLRLATTKVGAHRSFQCAPPMAFPSPPFLSSWFPAGSTVIPRVVLPSYFVFCVANQRHRDLIQNGLDTTLEDLKSTVLFSPRQTFSTAVVEQPLRASNASRASAQTIIISTRVVVIFRDTVCFLVIPQVEGQFSKQDYWRANEKPKLAEQKEAW